MNRDLLLVALEVIFIAAGLAGIVLLFGASVALIVGGVVGVAAVEAKA